MSTLPRETGTDSELFTDQTLCLSPSQSTKALMMQLNTLIYGLINYGFSYQNTTVDPYDL